jgi:hypothetical protein
MVSSIQGWAVGASSVATGCAMVAVVKNGPTRLFRMRTVGSCTGDWQEQSCLGHGDTGVEEQLNARLPFLQIVSLGCTYVDRHEWY